MFVNSFCIWQLTVFLAFLGYFDLLTTKKFKEVQRVQARSKKLSTCKAFLNLSAKHCSKNEPNTVIDRFSAFFAEEYLSLFSLFKKWDKILLCHTVKKNFIDNIAPCL